MRERASRRSLSPIGRSFRFLKLSLSPSLQQVAVLLNMFPGRIAGLHVRPNRIKCVFRFPGNEKGESKSRKRRGRQKNSTSNPSTPPLPAHASSPPSPKTHNHDPNPAATTPSPAPTRPPWPSPPVKERRCRRWATASRERRMTRSTKCGSRICSGRPGGSTGRAAGTRPGSERRAGEWSAERGRERL